MEYDQTEAYDPLTSDVISHVPGHIRDNITLHEVVKIENELLGLAVWRLMEKEFCQIERMEEERDPTGMMLDKDKDKECFISIRDIPEFR